ncbi:MAG: hypothetical protein MJ237_00650 [bacterium]|nr:hypothetical protein [bacterium]
MTTFNEMEDVLKTFMIQEQSDAHNVKTTSFAKYNNIRLTMSPTKNPNPHITIRISISEATFNLNNFNKLNGGLGYEERLVIKWFGRYGIKEKLMELWAFAEKNNGDA